MLESKTKREGVVYSKPPLGGHLYSGLGQKWCKSHLFGIESLIRASYLENIIRFLELVYN
jgi:hypothetical protein